MQLHYGQGCCLSCVRIDFVEQCSKACHWGLFLGSAASGVMHVFDQSDMRGFSKTGLIAVMLAILILVLTPFARNSCKAVGGLRMVKFACPT